MGAFFGLLACLVIYFVITCREKYYGSNYYKRKRESAKYWDAVDKLYDSSLAKNVLDYILLGGHEQEIFDFFQEDFEYIFGENWKEIISKTIPVVDDLKIDSSKKSVYTWAELLARETDGKINAGNKEQYYLSMSYDLILATQGKFDYDCFNAKCVLGEKPYCDIYVKFFERLEKRLVEAGVENIHFGLFKEHRLYDKPRSPDDLVGGVMSVRFPSEELFRLWGDDAYNAADCGNEEECTPSIFVDGKDEH